MFILLCTFRITVDGCWFSQADPYVAHHTWYVIAAITRIRRRGSHTPHTVVCSSIQCPQSVLFFEVFSYAWPTVQPTVQPTVHLQPILLLAKGPTNMNKHNQRHPICAGFFSHIFPSLPNAPPAGRYYSTFNPCIGTPGAPHRMSGRLRPRFACTGKPDRVHMEVSRAVYRLYRSDYHTQSQLAKMSFDRIFDLTAGVYVFSFFIILNIDRSITHSLQITE